MSVDKDLTEHQTAAQDFLLQRVDKSGKKPFTNNISVAEAYLIKNPESNIVFGFQADENEHYQNTITVLEHKGLKCKKLNFVEAEQWLSDENKNQPFLILVEREG